METKMTVQTKSESSILEHLVSDIKQGRIALPRFQRDFVWNLDASASLIDSILSGYPIGALIFWSTAEKLRDVRNLGRIELQKPPAGKEINYVLDGQQRLTSLFASIIGAEVTLSDGRQRDFRNIWVDLSELENDHSKCVASIRERDETRCIRLHELFDSKLKDIFDRFPPDTHENVEAYKSILNSYRIPYMQLENAPISVATEVFSRVNIGGKSLTLFEIMVAKTYDSKTNFDLLEKWEKLHAKLSKRGFDTVDPINILQIISLILEKDARKRTILEISKVKFINTWPEAEKALKSAVDFVRDTLRLPVSRLLPYTALLAPIALFFHLNGNKPPNSIQSKQLQDFFWRVGWSSRYTGSVETNLQQDANKIEHIISGKSFSYDFPMQRDLDWLITQEFRANEAFSKTVLAMLAYERPASFADDSLVNLSNDSMRRANSKNFHHFFPKAFLRKQGTTLSANSIVNITLIDGFLNKHKIRARAPSDYMGEYDKDNENFKKNMSTHLIGVGSNSGIWDDNYERFLRKRGSRILKRLSSKLIESQ